MLQNTFLQESPKEKERSSRFVEYWNKQPNVPKQKIGTKSYKMAHKFFLGIKNKTTGISGFVLTEEEQKRLGLSSFYKTDFTDLDVFSFIETVAKIYHLSYAPLEKDKLPKSLLGFLYNPRSKKYITFSFFLHCLLVSKPKKAENFHSDKLVEDLSEAEFDLAVQLRDIYLAENGLDELSENEKRQLVSIVQKIVLEYGKIPIQNVSVFASNFGSFTDFTRWFIQFLKNHKYENITLTAFDVDRRIWRKFVGHVSKDFGYDFYSGREVR